ncbi:pseudouridine synthase [Leptolyngbya ohadii]|uniref:pseudouridine synthase n=1 Tax=Leptolyngbya ohadii TaxID=1962290 RepID=UPI000B599D48|nr:pseudouridine synthase [Leptolyngbya ohadii]
MAERVQKILSQRGIASRRQAEQMILEGRVRINGQVIQLGQLADPERDRIEVDGRLIPRQRPTKLYMLLNKPAGVVSTRRDPEGRITVMDLLPPELHEAGVHPVGRLDTASTGALLLTNDGDLTLGLTHPRHTIPKLYRVWVKGQPTNATLNRWRQGILLEERKTLPALVEVMQVKPDRTLLEIELREGRNRQIRKVADLLGHPVIRLRRVAIGAIHLGQLPEGHYRSLTDNEIKALKAQIKPTK